MKKNILLIAFLTGLVSLIYQVYGFQVLFLFFINGTKSAATSTSSSLFGIAIAAYLFSRKASKINALRIFLILNVGMILYAQLVLKNHELIPTLLTQFNSVVASEGAREFLKVILFWLFLFVPSFCIGGTFPLLNGLFSHDEKIFKDTGVVYFWDTIGAGIGALLAGFYLIPELGLVHTINIVTLLNIVLILLVDKKIGILMLALFGVFFGLSFYQNKNSHPDLNKRFGTILFQEKSPFGLVTAGTNQGNKVLFINYREMCRTINEAVQITASDILSEETVAISPQGSEILNLGLGCGLTAAKLIKSDKVSHLDVVEINPVVLKAAGSVFKNDNLDIVHHPKASILIDDGANYLRNNKKIYHAIVIDIEEVSVIYSSPLYTVEYLKMMKKQLHPDGLVSLWSFDVNDSFHKTLYNTFKAVFPYVRMQFFPGSVNIYGSERPIELKFTTDQQASNERERKILSLGLTDKNTINNRALEKYYNSNKNFHLPEDYREEFVR